MRFFVNGTTLIGTVRAAPFSVQWDTTTAPAAAFSNLVGVASIEQPGLVRVKPNDPDNSYLIHKVEGTAGITGAQMPFGGPALSQATIDQIRAWISSGALND
jgi:hypothetical protein